MRATAGANAPPCYATRFHANPRAHTELLHQRHARRVRNGDCLHMGQQPASDSLGDPDPHLHDAIMQMLPSPHPAVMYQSVADGAVLLHTQDEIYFGLNTVGARVWQLLPPHCMELDDLCSTLSAEYPDVDAMAIREDVIALLERLHDDRLVVEAE